MEIRSGWRPLFNTLRAANNSNQYSAILEIFKVFLNTDNTLVFANAALDCILCLLSHIKGLHYDEVQVTETKKKATTPTKPKPNINLKFSKNSKFIPLNEEKTEKVIVDMCKEALYHLESCADILTMMYNMPKCPIFNTGNRIKGDMPLSVVDPLIPSASLDITKFITNENYEEEFVTYRELSTSLRPSSTTNNCLLKLDKPSNILKVWYVLIEGLISATVVCSRKNQPAAMETLFKLLKNTMDVPGTYFGLHCINHLLLPMVQNWLRQISSINTHWDSVLPNFKQCCGMTTDTVVVYLHHLQQINVERTTRDENDEEFEPIEIPELTFALKQIMLILVECVAQPQEPIARLGASCIRHIILTSGHLLTDNQWEIVCKSLHRACNVSLTPLKQITFAFKENSNSFYGDLAIVKVAARRDCSVNDNVRLHAMAQQVFLNEHVKNDAHPKLTPKNSSQNLMLIDDRSYIFLVYLQETINSLNPELYTVRIPHRGLVVGLLAHQILVQIIATVLIQSSSDVFHGINNILLESFQTGTNICNYKFFLNANNSDLLLKALDLSYMRAMQFDCRPGLKFLVQKVSNLDYAANLYKQTTSSWLIKMIALTEIFFCGAQRFQYDPQQVSLILDKNRSVIYPLEYERYVIKARDLKSTWELLCNSYVKHLISVSDFDEPDSVKERVSISSIGSIMSSIHGDEYYTEDNENTTQIPKTDDNLIQNSNDDIEKPRPFTFADFKENNSITVEIHNDSDASSIKDAIITESNKSEMDISSESEADKYNGEEKDPNDNSKRNKASNKNRVATSPIEEKEINISTDLDNNKGRKVNITICDGPNFDATKTKNLEPLLPPQPVPPEIEQQRALSISKV